jgi:glycogen debranching enzyme
MAADTLTATSEPANETRIPAGFQDADEVLPQYHIEAQTSLVERPLRSLKYGESFAVLDSYGDIGVLPGPEGLYFQDTRYLSRMHVTIEDQRPLLLSSVMQDDNGALSVDMTTPDIRMDAHDETTIPRELIAIERTKFLFRGACYDRIGLRNYDSRHRTLKVAVTFDADFRDLFEVRGMDRPVRGKRSVQVASPSEVQFRYAGLDEVVRTTSLHFGPTPKHIEPGRNAGSWCPCRREGEPRCSCAWSSNRTVPSPARPPPSVSARMPPPACRRQRVARPPRVIRRVWPRA